MAALNEMGLQAAKQFLSRAVFFFPKSPWLAREDRARQRIAENLPPVPPAKRDEQL